MLKSDILGCWGRSIPNILRSIHIAFHNGCIIVHSKCQWKSFLLGIHHFLSELSLALLILAILRCKGQNLKVNLIYISLMANGAEHLFKCFPVICVFSIEKSLYHSVSHFNWIFLLSNILISLYSLDTSPLLAMELVWIFL